MLAPNRLGLRLIGTAALLFGCTSGQAPDRSDDVLLVPSPRPVPSSDLDLVRAPACLGQPTPKRTPQYARSYVDFVQVNGRVYVMVEPQPSNVTGGRKLGSVRCTFDRGYAPVGHVTVDGDASRLPVGTPLLAARPVGGRPAVVANLPRGPLLYVLLSGG